MAPQDVTEPAGGQLQEPHWGLVSRIAFRFCFVYLGLFCLNTQIIVGLRIPFAAYLNQASSWPIREVVLWAAAHVFGVGYTLNYTNGGSGDKTFDWVLAFCLLVVGALATALWSLLDRNRGNYVTLNKWFRLFIRLALAAQMLTYGIDKVIPVQMPYPNLYKLVEPAGKFSLMGALWWSVGVSPAYEIFAGGMETLGGLLLVIPRTAMLGALICMADMVQVFALNMTYDAPVKLLSFHLLLLAIFLLAPEAARLMKFFVLNRFAEPSTQPPLFRTTRANRIAVTLQLILGIWLVGVNAYGAQRAWYRYGGGAPKSPLYGIWDVEQLTDDGQYPAFSSFGPGRWRRVIFEAPTRMSVQRTDDAIYQVGVSINATDNILTFGPHPETQLHYQRVAKNKLILEGTMDNQKLHMQLQLVDLKQFLLVSRGFHWIQEYSLNR